LITGTFYTISVSLWFDC